MTGNIFLRAISMFSLLAFILVSCNRKSEATNEIKLKREGVISCGTPDNEFGRVEFETSCSDKTKKDFNLAISMLHSFEYNEAEKMFAKIIDKQPDCAMAYWGVAMSNYHTLWAPPTIREFEKGAKAIAIAQSIKQKSAIENDYINALAFFYKNQKTIDHRIRSKNFEKAMEKIYIANPKNKEAAIFYALTLIATSDLADKSYTNQREAVKILNALYPNQPNHPGIVHYIIHAYDNPELAILALPAARKYASIAPSSSHAQHMPSHIFTRLGLWDESINSNKVAAYSAKCYAESLGIKGHWDEELHCIDYLVYAYLQKGDNTAAKKQWNYLKTIHDIEPKPLDFKVFCVFAAVPSRYVLENKMWKEAASLHIYPANLPWKNFPWEEATIHFTRLLGAVHIGDSNAARSELKKLDILHNHLMKQNDLYKANKVMIQIKAGEAWILVREGKETKALQLMAESADMEDKTEKHPVTPGEVLPARELQADMFLLLNKPGNALTAYEEDLKKHPNRFNGLYGAAIAAERVKNFDKATYYYRKLITIANAPGANRPELEKAALFLRVNKTTTKLDGP